MKKEAKRICIYPKDVQLITGKSYRYARLLIQEIKKNNGKNKQQLVSVEEFCNYTGLTTEEVRALIVG